MVLTSPSNPKRVPAAALPFGRVLLLDLFYCSYSVKPQLFFFLGTRVLRAGLGLEAQCSVRQQAS